MLNPDNVLWWSHGGELHGESWKRFGFLHDIMCETPGIGLAPYDWKWDCVCGVPETEFLKKIKSYYLFYYGFTTPRFKEFEIDQETEYEIEVIDTWNMTITKAGTGKGKFRVELPARRYMAIRLKKVENEEK
jgi:hypothetical protein